MYRVVLIYNEEGNFVGSSILQDGASRLQSTNIYVEGEETGLATQLDRLNKGQNLRAVWPDARDPDVVAVLADDNFMPVEKIEDDVIDEEKSHIVWHVDEDGEETGLINEAASVLVYKKMMVPARPSDVMERTKKAQEVVAQRRAA